MNKHHHLHPFTIHFWMRFIQFFSVLSNSHSYHSSHFSYFTHPILLWPFLHSFTFSLVPFEHIFLVSCPFIRISISPLPPLYQLPLSYVSFRLIPFYTEHTTVCYISSLCRTFMYIYVPYFFKCNGLYVAF